ncbi:MAG: outer membrane beta-barrel protein [Bacteroidales bacterium]
MKKLIFLSILLVGMTSFCLNAQLFVGGNIGLNTSGGKTDNDGEVDKGTKTLGVDINPMFGYYLNENMAAGFKLILSMDRTVTPPYFEDGDETIYTVSSFGLAPFLRYHFIRFGKFSVFGQGQLSVVFGSGKTKIGDNTNEDPKVTSIGISVFPGLSFDISDNFSLETSLNAFGLGYSISQTNNENTNIKTTNSSGYLGLNLDNIKTLGSITVGAIYRF